MSTIEHELAARISRLSPDQQRRVLEFVQTLEAASELAYSARDLMKLPVEERIRLIEAAFALAAEEDFEIFEAYGDEDLDESS